MMRRGTIGNTSFVAIPYNANAKEGAMVVADFLLSPEAQARMQNPEVLGNPTVLDLRRLSPEDRRLFEDLPKAAATLSEEELGVPLPEPHPSWMNRIVEEWERRYSK
jgi:putative thiamine transport system substrate-binding protein